MTTGGFHSYWVAGFLAGYYMCAWLIAGRKPSGQSIAVRYNSPEGLSPAALRYVYTMACDGRAYAAIIAQLAARKLLEIIPDRASGKIIMQKMVENGHVGRSLPEEEARVFKDLFEWSDRVELKRPGLSTIARIQKALDARQTSAYFTRNFIWVACALALTYGGTVWLGLSSGLFGHDTVDAWTGSLFAGLTVAMYGLAGYWVWDTNRLAFSLALRGMYQRTTLPALLAFVLLYPALWFLLIRTVAPKFAALTTALIVINTFAGVSLRNYTSSGRILRDHIEGYRQFLASAVQDRLQRMNIPGDKAKFDVEMIPYAIALDLSEAWGDNLGTRMMIEISL